MARQTKKEQELEVALAEATADVQRLRADFENYRKRAELEKAQISRLATAAAVMKLLPVADTIERAIAHAPRDLQDHAWVQGVTSITKNLEKSLGELGLTRIAATAGTPFDPSLHEAVAADDTEGEHELIAEELRAGYTMGEQTVRPAMVKVTKK